MTVRTTGEDNDDVKDNDSKDDRQGRQGQQARTTTTARTMTARTTAMTARTTTMMAATATVVAVAVVRLVGRSVGGDQVSGVVGGCVLCHWLLGAYIQEELYRHVLELIYCGLNLSKFYSACPDAG
jgi:hypothetical protein